MTIKQHTMMMDFIRHETARLRRGQQRRELVRSAVEWLRRKVGVDARRIVGVVGPVELNGRKT